jgi:putative restriction endonuclease
VIEKERFLKQASGNLYSTDSKAYHWALEQLRDHLVAIGFTVNKKARPERTLRVYPTRSRQYPLLNPSFRPTAVQLGEIYDIECLYVSVLSRADDGSLDRKLGTFASTSACTFHALPPGATDGLHYHGVFILPLRFLDKSDKQEIDFAALRGPLAQIFAFLQGIAGKNDPVPPPPERVFGEIPGVPIGTVFATREELSRAGVHRPLQAGISGSGGEGANSIVLSGGYEDDSDEGDTIIYTGHGGRDPESGKQIRNQELTRGNLALKKNQTDGLPVRVVRGPNMASSFAPSGGYRYDGLYRVEDTSFERGKSNFKVLRFTLVRIQEEAPSPPVGGQPPPGPAGRRSTTVLRIVRDTALGLQVKAIYGYACQVCGLAIQGPGALYAEAAHIRPLGRPHDGPDVLTNLLCLCPNHHVLFDLGAFTVRDDLSLAGIKGRLTVKDGHRVDPDHLLYRREHYAQLSENVTEKG